MTTTTTNGTVAQIFGPVVDVRFPVGALPPIYTALSVDGTAGEAGRLGDLVLEVAQHLGNDVVRCVAMATTDGCRRGLSVTNSGAPISVPVGDRTKGRIFSLLGEALDTVERLLELRPDPLGGRQRPAVDLPVGGQRQLIQGHEGGRDHVLGQPLAEDLAPSTDARRILFATLRRNQVGGQTFVAGIIAPDQDDRLFHALVLAEQSLDLTEFDAEAPDFDLLVDAPEVVEFTVRQEAHQITRAVEPFSSMRMGDEGFGRFLWVIPIFSGQTNSTDIYISCNPSRARLKSRVEDRE